MNWEPYGFNNLPLADFQLDESSINRIREELKSKFGIEWKQKFQKIYVVTDSNFSRTNNPAGGSYLLAKLAETDDLQWDLAVIYSQEAKLDRLNEQYHSRVELIHSSGEQSKTVSQDIRVYFATGVFPALEKLWGLLAELNVLLLCVQTAAVRLKRKEAILFSGLKKYGFSSACEISAEHVFDPALIGWNSQPVTLFSYETSRGFTEPIRKTFENYLTAATKLLHQPSIVDQDSAWERIFRALHPVESLEKVGPIRRLWEIIQTSRNVCVIDTHPMLREQSLSARERCWVRRRLKEIIEYPITLDLLLEEFHREHWSLAQIATMIERVSLREKMSID
jgi:hypothetical protein